MKGATRVLLRDLIYMNRERKDLTWHKLCISQSLKDELQSLPLNCSVTHIHLSMNVGVLTRLHFE